MASTLRICFSGLCLFVRDTRGPKPLMHVLLPDVRGHHHHPHALRLWVHPAHLGSGNPNRPPTVPLRDHRLDDQHVTIGQTATGATLTLPPEIIDLSSGQFAGKKVLAGLVDNPTAPKVGARFTLGGGGLVDCAEGTSWTLHGTPVCLTHQAVWEIPEMDSVQLNPKGINGKPNRTLPPFYKTTGDDVIEIHVYNARPDDMPGYPPPIPPNPGYQARHFDAYYDLFSPGAKRGNPVLRQIGTGVCGKCGITVPEPAPEDAGPAETNGAEMERAGSGHGPKARKKGGVDPYKCMLAGGGTLP